MDEPGAGAADGAGVYVIRCVPSGLAYVGSSVNVRVRFQSHRAALARGCHYNAGLQAAWHAHGPAAFEFTLLEEVDRVEQLGPREEYWIARLRVDEAGCGFNVSRRVWRSPLVSLPAVRPPVPVRVSVAVVPPVPIRRERVAHLVEGQLARIIFAGKLRQGDALPPERELAKRFGVSRATVREALRALQLWGLIDARQGGGNYVSLPSLDHIIAPLASIIQHNRALQDELLDARFVFEPEVCWLAAQRRTDADLAAIEAIVARQTQRVEQGELAVEEDSAFHLALAEATHNRVIPQLIQTINDLLLESRLRSLRTPDRPRRSLEGHLRILAALRASDAEAARQAMRDHITAIADSLRSAGMLPA